MRLHLLESVISTKPLPLDSTAHDQSKFDMLLFCRMPNAYPQFEQMPDSSRTPRPASGGLSRRFELGPHGNFKKLLTKLAACAQAKTEHGRRNNPVGKVRSRRGYAGVAARSSEGEDQVPLQLILYLFLFLFVSIPIIVNAQRVFVSEGINMSEVAYFEPLGLVGTHYGLLRSKDKAITVHLYDGAMRPHQTLKMSLALWPSAAPLEAWVYKDNIWVLLQYKQRNDWIFRVHCYDTQGVMKDSAEVCRLNDRTESIRFLTAIAPDKSSVAILAQTTNNLRVFVAQADAVLSPNMYEINLSKPLDEDAILKLAPDCQGGAYVVFETDNYHAVRQKHRVELHYFGPTGKRQHTQLNPQGALTVSLQTLTDTINRCLHVCALYATQNMGRAHGFWQYRFDGSSPAVDTVTRHPFSSALSNSLQEGVSNDSSISDYGLVRLGLRRDGGLVIFLERQREVSRVGASQRLLLNEAASSAMRDYFVEQVAVLSVIPDGGVSWSARCYKKQFSFDDSAIYSSFGVLTTDKRLMLLYNDEIKQGTNVSAYVISNKGIISRKAIFGTDDQEILILWKYLVQTDETSCIVPSVYHNKLRLVRLIL